MEADTWIGKRLPRPEAQAKATGATQGAHNNEIFRQWLRFGEEEIGRLKEEGIL